MFLCITQQSGEAGRPAKSLNSQISASQARAKQIAECAQRKLKRSEAGRPPTQYAAAQLQVGDR